MNKQYGLLCGTHYPRLYFSYGESTCIILVLYYKLYLCLNSASTELMGAAFLPRNPLLDPENQHDGTAVAKSIFFYTLWPLHGCNCFSFCTFCLQTVFLSTSSSMAPSSALSLGLALSLSSHSSSSGFL